MNNFECAIADLHDIIRDYRNDDGLFISHQTIARWISQFNKESRYIILSELIHIFKNLYISKSKINNFITKVATSNKLTNNNPISYWSNVSLLSIQQDGESQKHLVKLLKDEILKKFNINVPINDFTKSKYFYIDDFLFSGKKLKTDLSYLFRTLSNPATLTIGYIGFFTSGKYHIDKWIKENNPNNIEISYRCTAILENRTNRPLSSSVLLPTDDILQYNNAHAYLQIQEKYFLRNQSHTINSSSIFSNEEHKKILEKEFTLAGLKINNTIKEHNKKILWKPLGISAWGGFGFRALVSTYRNCPNNTPLALWWGEWEHNSIWYPLFPRKTYK